MHSIVIDRLDMQVLLKKIEANDSTPIYINNSADIEGKVFKVYLTERNILSLRAKLDSVQNGGDSLCTIIKHDTAHSEFPCTSRVSVKAVGERSSKFQPYEPTTAVFGVADSKYYVDRNPGKIHPDHDPANQENK